MPFWGSQKTTKQGIAGTTDKEYQQEASRQIRDFSDKMEAFRHQGTLVIEQFMESPPKNYNEGVQISKGVQANMLKIASDISKIEFPKEVIVGGKRYVLKDEQVSIKEIKDNYINGFTLTAKGYDYAAPYFENKNRDDLKRMKDAFAQADKYFIKGIYNLEILKQKYMESMDNNNIKTFISLKI